MKTSIVFILISRNDITKVKIEVKGSSRFFPGSIKEEHYTVCMEPGGKFLFHFTPQKLSEEEKYAEIVANNLIEWMFQHGVDISMHWAVIQLMLILDAKVVSVC